jgi:hypothetical protein
MSKCQQYRANRLGQTICGRWQGDQLMTEFGTAATIGIALIATGRLWATLGDVEEINVVCGTRRPARVRAFIDFLFDGGDLEDPPQLLDTMILNSLSLFCWPNVAHANRVYLACNNDEST